MVVGSNVCLSCHHPTEYFKWIVCDWCFVPSLCWQHNSSWSQSFIKTASTLKEKNRLPCDGYQSAHGPVNMMYWLLRMISCSVTRHRSKTWCLLRFMPSVCLCCWFIEKQLNPFFFLLLRCPKGKLIQLLTPGTMWWAVHHLPLWCISTSFSWLHYCGVHHKGNKFHSFICWSRL